MAKYATLLAKDDKKAEKAKIALQVEETQIQVDADLLKIKKAIASKTAELSKVKSTFPLDTTAAIELANEIESLGADSEALEALKAELF